MGIFEFKPPKNIKKLQLVLGILLLGSIAVLLLTYILTFPAEWTVQLIGLGMLCLGVFVFTRYIIKDFVYESVVDENGGIDFTVTEETYKKSIVVCRISTANIEKVLVAEQGDKVKELEIKQRIKDGKYKKFNYCADLFDEKYILVLAKECGQPVALKLSYHPSLLSFLQQTEEN